MIYKLVTKAHTSGNFMYQFGVFSKNMLLIRKEYPPILAFFVFLGNGVVLQGITRLTHGVW
jgi:hypothetical protein